MPPIKWKRVWILVLLIILICNLDDLQHLWERCIESEAIVEAFEPLWESPPLLLFADILLLFALIFLAAYKIAMAWAPKPMNHLHIYMDKENGHPEADGKPDHLPYRDGYESSEMRPAVRSSNLQINRLRDSVADRPIDNQVVESPTMESRGAQGPHRSIPSMIERVLSNLNN